MVLPLLPCGPAGTEDAYPIASLDEAGHEKPLSLAVPYDQLAWFCPGVIRVVEDAGQGSPKTDTASSNVTPCF